MTENAVVARGLNKSYTVTIRGTGVRAAVRSLVRPVREVREVIRDVDLTIGEGSFVALLGPNGAGKSTLIKMLTGILVPSSGELLVNGRVPHRDRQRAAYEIGAVFGQRTQLWWDLPAIDSLTILRDVYGVPDGVHERRLAEFDDLLGLSEFWSTPVRHLSLGQRVRCDLAASMIHDPRTIFLDEPTIGMDVVVKEQVRTFLRHQVAERGKTVLLTTHDMTEVAQLCERLVLINHGRVTFDGSLSDLRGAQRSTPTIHVTFGEPVYGLSIAGARILRSSPLHAVVEPEPGEHRAVIAKLVTDLPVVDLRVEEQSVEELVRDAFKAVGA